MGCSLGLTNQQRTHPQYDCVLLKCCQNKKTYNSGSDFALCYAEIVCLWQLNHVLSLRLTHDLQGSETSHEELVRLCEFAK